MQVVVCSLRGLSERLMANVERFISLVHLYSCLRRGEIQKGILRIKPKMRRRLGKQSLLLGTRRAALPCVVTRAICFSPGPNNKDGRVCLCAPFAANRLTSTERPAFFLSRLALARCVKPFVVASCGLLAMHLASSFMSWLKEGGDAILAL